MATAGTDAPKTPLGVGSIISDSFSIMFGNFAKVLLLGFTGAIVGLIVSAAFLGFDLATGIAEPDAIVSANIGVVGWVVPTLVNMVIYGLVTALIIQLAYDAKLGRSNSIGTYFSAALPALFPIIVLSIVVLILTSLGAFALVIGALWVYAVFYVTVPVVVIERGGFGSMGRSATLTKEYRWSIAGLLVVVLAMSVIVQIVAGFLIAALAFVVGGLVGQIVIAVSFAGINGIAYAFGGIAGALTYARLREIKEGVAVDQIAAVFD
ncbi:hypothetical protein [Roseobacter weihaiensis]|uniref:hypothetical protein n=1 Tax=Roseobacter weihaiensis TaxID=2763262 RepID=UPI001D0A485C|nr:hypothetical protein [Roseobacter sp. H9]